MVRIGEAECNRDSLIQTALAEEKRMASKFVNDTEIELYKRNFEIKKAGYDMEVETARAQSELAFQLQVHHNDFIATRNCRKNWVATWKCILSKRPNQYCLFYDFKRCVTSNLSIICIYFCC